MGKFWTTLLPFLTLFSTFWDILDCRCTRLKVLQHQLAVLMSEENMSILSEIKADSWFKLQHPIIWDLTLWTVRFGVFARFITLQFFLTQKTWKKRPQKLLIIGPQLFLCTGPAAQTAQKQKSCTTKSPLMQDWVFRLGHKPNLKKNC